MMKKAAYPVILIPQSREKNLGIYLSCHPEMLRRPATARFLRMIFFNILPKLPAFPPGNSGGLSPNPRSAAGRSASRVRAFK